MKYTSKQKETICHMIDGLNEAKSEILFYITNDYWNNNFNHDYGVCDHVEKYILTKLHRREIDPIFVRYHMNKAKTYYRDFSGCLVFPIQDPSRKLTPQDYYFQGNLYDGINAKLRINIINDMIKYLENLI